MNSTLHEVKKLNVSSISSIFRTEKHVRFIMALKINIYFCMVQNDILDGVVYIQSYQT